MPGVVNKQHTSIVGVSILDRIIIQDLEVVVECGDKYTRKCYHHNDTIDKEDGFFVGIIDDDGGAQVEAVTLLSIKVKGFNDAETDCYNNPGKHNVEYDTLEVGLVLARQCGHLVYFLAKKQVYYRCDNNHCSQNLLL